MDIAKADEYYNFFKMDDTVFHNPAPLLVELNFNIESCDMPLCSWVVLSLDSAGGKSVYYERIPLSLVKYNWLDTNKNEDMILETCPIPSKVKRFICYLWNFKKQRIKMTINSVKVFQLEGYGVDTVADVKGNY
jgi:hypothetical protein